MKKNVVLLRVSTDMQDFESQKNGIERYVEENKIIVHKTIEEEGVSGFKTKLEDRKGLQELIQMALDGELDTVICFNQDRLGRRLEILSFMSIMKEQGVKVISVTEGLLNEDNDTSDLIQAIKFWTANYESKKTSLRVKAGKRATIEKNGYSGGVPNFGYKVDGKRLVIDEEERKVVVLIFETYIESGTQKVMEVLKENNILKRGEPFTKSKIFSILHNNIYRGMKEYQDELLDFPELRIISDEVFFKAQERAKSRNTRGTTRYTNRTDILFEGLLFHRCEDGIERKLNIDYVKVKDGKRTHTYRCRHCRDIKAQITKNFISTKIEPIIIDSIKSVMRNLSIEKLEERYNKEKEEYLVDIKENISILNKNLEKKNKALKNATNEIEKIFMGESSTDIDIINNLINKIKYEIEEIKTSLEVQSEEIKSIENKTSDIFYLLEKYKDFEVIFDKASRGEQKLMLQELVKRVVISYDTINIELNLY
ncbi:MAG: recombinase family protein [Turicibacter sp.]|nr:recombinase family protein [Turicibacter sp.]MDO4925378.1 recombinase family protein [Turicibacter sp.]